MSGRELGTALAAACRKDCAAGAGAHALAETVCARTPAVARLERTLAQEKSPSFVLCMLRSKQIVVVADHRAAEWPASMLYWQRLTNVTPLAHSSAKALRGYVFRPPPARDCHAVKLLAFLPAISPEALKRISREVRRRRPRPAAT